MRPLPEHALVLGNALFAIHETDELGDVYSYLNMAAGVRAVEFDTPALGGHPSMCSGASEIDDEQLSGTLAHRLAVFTFTLAAVDAYENCLRIGIRDPLYPGGTGATPSDPNRGIQLTDAESALDKYARPIEALCYYLCQRYSDPYPSEYVELLRAFKAAAAAAGIGRRPAAVNRKLPAYIQPVAEGLYLIHEFRHTLANGNFSEPDAEGDPETHPYIVVVELATRVLLFTLQMMTLCIYDGDASIESVHLEVYRGDAEYLSLRDVFSNLHLENIDHLVASEE